MRVLAVVMLVATTAAQGNPWLDWFTFWDALFVTLLLSADFFLYPAEKLAIKNVIAQWWVRIEDSKFTGFVREDAERLRKVIEKIFGSRWLSLRFISIEVVISLSLTLLLLESIPEVQATDFSVERIFGAAVLVFLPINAFFGWLSLASTLSFFRKMSRTIGLPEILLLSFLDLLLFGVFVSLTLTTTIAAARFATCFLGHCDPFVFSFVETHKILVLMLKQYPTATQRMILAATVCGMFSILHLLIALGFLVSKLLTAVLKPPLSRFLYGVHDAPVGALSLFAVIAGGFFKLVELYLKARG
jgi:hypothetical protein